MLSHVAIKRLGICLMTQDVHWAHQWTHHLVVSGCQFLISLAWLYFSQSVWWGDEIRRKATDYKQNLSQKEHENRKMDMKKMERWSGQGDNSRGWNEEGWKERVWTHSSVLSGLAASLFGRTCSLNCIWVALQIQKRSKFRAMQKTIKFSACAPFMKKLRSYTLHYNKLRRLECTGINLFFTVVSNPFRIWEIGKREEGEKVKGN